MTASRSILLFIAAMLMGFATFLNATLAVPHLREDMSEIGVRPTLLQAVMASLHFGTLAMLVFFLVVLFSAVQSFRGRATNSLPLFLIGVAYVLFGIAAFLVTRNHHTLGYALIGLLLVVAVALPRTSSSRLAV